MRISIIGTGYVGLVSGTCLASFGHSLICVDIRLEVVEKINRGIAPIYELGLEPLLLKVVESGNLRATTDLTSAVRDSDITLICVGTPTIGAEADLSQLQTAATAIGAALAEKSGYHAVVVKSTVLPGTTEGIVKVAIEASSGKRLGNGWGLCMNPEFLREGRAVEDFNIPDRIVIGVTDQRVATVALGMYEQFDCPKLVTSPRTAEMIKYVSNSLLATLISFSNEIANLCATTQGVDARDVWKGVHLDRRLTPAKADREHPPGVVEYLWHGLGFGGSCFPKDVAALRGFGQKVGVPTAMLDAVLAINALQPMQMVSLLEQELSPKGRTIAILGLAFKPGTDDLRHSPALPVIRALLECGATVVVHDPIAMPGAQKDPIMKGAVFASSWQSALKNADACCLITSWPEYRDIRPPDVLRLMKTPVVIDGRGLFDPAEFMAAGIRWRGIGYTPAK
ncbi:MAG: UDP-glucose/GDP-mannose dehydrogenase family protein [Nitrospiraceae bacterium]